MKVRANVAKKKGSKAGHFPVLPDPLQQRRGVASGLFYNNGFQPVVCKQV
ncbi:MAG: hypothetical protein IPG86_07885 [Chitinophagaceae bacterium]|nr:hypothetical protein [Chitinophagaceae bacterium]